MLRDFYFADPRLVLVPIEHLSPAGVSRDFATALGRHYGKDRSERASAIVEIIDTALPLYWTRIGKLSKRSRNWAPPRIRNIAIVQRSTAIPPYVQLLNTSTWTLFDCDFDRSASNAELVTYLLAHGDRMSVSGEATMAAVRNAAYWFGLTVDETAEFQRGARSTTRPDAEAFHALAEAVPWLRELAHETMRPPATTAGYRPIPGTGLLVPRSLERKPAELVAKWTAVAKECLSSYYRSAGPADSASLKATLEWLSETAPDLVVTGHGNRILWDPIHPRRLGALRHELRGTGAGAQRSILRDLEVIDYHSRTFRECCKQYESLTVPGEDIGQDGYTYLYQGRKILAYNLHEPHLDRLKVAALPFARAMLGARASHEWGHLAVDAGWVPTTVATSVMAERVGDLRDAFDEIFDAADDRAVAITRADLTELRHQHPAGEPTDTGGEKLAIEGESSGAAILRMLLPRVADYKANLLASQLQRVAEREAYVRQNIRSLRAEYGATQVWRMLARYVYELQYSRFSAIENPRSYFLVSTWFEHDFFATGLVTEEQFDRVRRAFSTLLESYTVDQARIALPTHQVATRT